MRSHTRGRGPKRLDQYHRGKPGARWAIMAKFIIERRPGEPYLTRWRIVQTPFFGILLHRIDGADPDPDPHDHPFNFISIVIKGGYTEVVDQIGKKQERFHHRRFSIHTFTMGHFHRIVKLDREPTWTLVLVGPRKDEWGFLSNGKRIPWKTYLGLEN